MNFSPTAHKNSYSVYNDARTHSLWCIHSISVSIYFSHIHSLFLFLLYTEFVSLSNAHRLFLTLVFHVHSQIHNEFIDTYLLLLILESLHLPCTFVGQQEDYIILIQDNSSTCPAVEQGKYERFLHRFIRYSLIDLLSVEIYKISHLKQFFKTDVSFFLVLMGFPFLKDSLECQHHDYVYSILVTELNISC